jgi:hypothetical protein
MCVGKYVIWLCAVVLNVPVVRSQSLPAGETDYRIESFGSAATGRFTPFWLVGNRYGIVPLDAGNAYLRAGVFHQQLPGRNLRWNAGIDVISAAPRYRNVYVHQVYAGIRFKFFDLTFGSKESQSSLWDKDLSSGDLVLSHNARPVPEINLSIPQFTPVSFAKGVLQVKGDFAVGRSFDTDYIRHFKNGDLAFTKNTLWHHKSLFLKLIDPQGLFPLTGVIGIRHHVQWGGDSDNPAVGRQPRSFKDFIRILLGQSGGDDSYAADKANVLGNHYGSYDFKIGYLYPAFDLFFYYQHYYEDTSGMGFYNMPDGLFGFQADLFDCSLFRRIVFEYVNTRDQSGPIHYIAYDHDKYPGYGEGADDYYNNYAYPAGVSYFNRSLGSPLVTSPEYNADGRLGFGNNRIRAFHLGLQGYFSKQVAYRLLTTWHEGWGTMNRPFLKKESNLSAAVKISYCHPRLEGWLFSGEVGCDFGDTYGNNAGFGFSVAKFGVFK